MLNVDGRKRAEAGAMVGHPWLEEVVERQEEEELVGMMRRDSVGSGNRVLEVLNDSSPSVSPSFEASL